MSDRLAVALLFPDLLGTYGDSGNAAILAGRARWRGQPAEVLVVHAGEAVPDSCDIYVLGGGEDMPQALAARELGRPGALHRAVDRGAAVLAVCAGMQVLGESFTYGSSGQEAEGLGLLDCRTVRGGGPRAVGELVVEPVAALGLPTLSGYENHAGATVLGPGASPLGRVLSGVGNGDGSGLEGAMAGRVLGTYMHGPVLARNAALADLLLGWVMGPLSPLDDSESEGLRAERLVAAHREAAPRGPSAPRALRLGREASLAARSGRLRFGRGLLTRLVEPAGGAGVERAGGAGVERAGGAGGRRA